MRLILVHYKCKRVLIKKKKSVKEFYLIIQPYAIIICETFEEISVKVKHFY